MRFQEKYRYGGWNNCIRLSNDEIEIIAVTDIGPRIIRFSYINEKNLFYEIPDNMGKTGGNKYRLYGGTRLWLGPENNPRSFNPDNDKINYSWDENTLKLTQAEEETTKIKKEIELSLDDDSNHAKLIYRVKNNNLWDVELAPWPVSIMNQKGLCIIPQEPYQSWEENYLPVRPLVLWAYTQMDDKRFYWGRKNILIKQDPELREKQKIGFLNTTGWIAYLLDEFVFIKRYHYSPLFCYPDFGVNTEIYTDENFLEIETFGEYKKISFNKSIEHREDWFLFKKKFSLDEKYIFDAIMPFVKKTEEKI